MSIRFKSTALILLGFALSAVFLPGQGFDAAKVRVVMWGDAVSSPFGEDGGPATYQIQIPEIDYVGSPDVISGAYGDTNSPSSLITTGVMGLNLEPGRKYLISVSTAQVDSWNVQATAPPGYSVEFDGVEATSWPNATSIRIVPQRDAFTARAGESTSIATGRVHWQVSLGSLPNGDSARCLVILDAARGAAWTDLFTPRGIGIQSNEVQGISDSSGDLRQVDATETVVDIITTSTTSYELRFYTRESATAPTGGSTLYTFVGKHPFVLYAISRDGSDTKLKIVRTDNTSTGQAARTSQTTLERTGTGSSDYVWTLNDWHDAGQSVVPVVEVTTWSNNGIGRLETIVKKDHASVVASTVKKQFETKQWGEELVSTTRGTVDAVTENLNYHVWVEQQDVFFPLAIRAKQSGGGNWEAYAYSVGGKRGLLKQTFRPYNGTPANPPDISIVNPSSWSTTSGEVVTVAYDSGGFNRVSSRVTTINGVQTSKSTTTYSESATPTGLAYVVATKNDWNTNTGGVATAQTVTKYFREDSSTHLLRNQIWSIQNPDGTKHAFTYQKGNYSGTTFSPNAAGGATRISAIKGRIILAGATKLDALSLPGETPATGAVAAGELDGVYVVANKSVLETTIRDESARLRRTETYVWSSGVWNLISSTDYSYDYANRLISRVASNGANYTATYKDAQNSDTAQLQWEEDETGNRTSYSYDKAGRVEISIKKGATGVAGDLKTTFAYDADGRVKTQTVAASPIAGQPTPSTESLVTSRTYDDAGRLRTETPPGLGATTYSYAPANRSQTVTYASTATRTETYATDGRLASVTGDAVVPEFYTYSIQASTGYRITKVNVGTANGPRYSESWTDQMGRTVRKSRPGFTGQVDFVESFNFSPSTGQLQSHTRTGYAPTLYEYNTMGQVSRTGLDFTGTSGALDLASKDRVTDTDESYENYLSQWWLTSVQTAYFVDNSTTPQVVARTRKRLTGLSGGLREEVRSRDAEGEGEDKDVVRTVSYTSSTRTLTASTARPGYEFAESATTVAGLAVSSTDHVGNTVTTTYDHLWRAATVVDPRTGASTLAYYSGTALLMTREDATKTQGQAGNITTHGYDPMGRVNLIRDAANSETRTGYNLRGQVLQQWGSGTYPVLFGYDSLGQRETMTTYQTGTGAVWSGATWPASPPAGNTTTWVFDPPSGLVEAKKDAANVTTNYTYNSRGQIYQIKSPRLNETSQPITVTHSYDGNTGELLGKSYNDGTAAQSYADRTPSIDYIYTRSGQTDSVVQGAGTSTALTHDLVYDPSARWRLSTEDWGSFYGNRLFTHSYENASAVSQSGGYGAAKLATVRGRSNGFTIGVSGNLAQDRAEVLYYSSLGRLAAVKTRAGTTAARDFVYGYAANSNLHSGYSSGGFTQSIQYEPKRDLISEVGNSWTTNVAASIAKFEYINDSVGRRYGTKQSCNLNAGSGTLGAFADLGGSIFYRYAYNGRGEMESGAAYLIEQPIPMADSPTPYAPSQLPERNFYYSFDDAGNRLASSPHGSSALVDSYTPNALNQYSSKQHKTVTVAGTANSGATVAVTSDGSSVPVTRRGRYWAGSAVLSNYASVAKASVAVTASIGGGGSDTLARTAIIRRADQAFAHDDAGNLTSDGLWDYKWDAENRLVAMETTATAVAQGIGNQKLSFRYDHLGRRIQKRSQNITAGTDVYRRYLYDGWNLVAEFAATATSCGTLVRSYSWGLDIAGSFSSSGGVGALLQIADNLAGTIGLAARDGNGNVVALINPDPNSAPLAAAYEYSPFGEILRAEGPMAAANPFRFSSKFTDDESGLVYYGHRYYQPDLGRFINRDPIDEEGGMNLYAFAGNNGVSRWDVLGLEDPKAEIVPLDRFVVNGGSKFPSASVFTIGIYSGSSLGLSTGSGVVATLTDNRSFTRQVEDIQDARRLLESLEKTKGSVSFEVLSLSILEGIDIDTAKALLSEPVEMDPFTVSVKADKAQDRTPLWRKVLGFVPVVGSALDAVDSFRKGNIGMGLLNLGLAAVDLTGGGALLKGALVGGFKLSGNNVVKLWSAYKNTGSWKSMQRNLVNNGVIAKQTVAAAKNPLSMTVDHVFIRRGRGAPHWLTNLPMNLNPGVTRSLNSRMNSMNFLELAGVAPAWVKWGIGNTAASTMVGWGVGSGEDGPR